MQELEKISASEESKVSPKELEKLLEVVVDFIETRYSKPYETSMAELEKLGKRLSLPLIGLKEIAWTSCKKQLKKYRKSLLALYTSTVETPQNRLVDFAYEFISSFLFY